MKLTRKQRLYWRLNIYLTSLLLLLWFVTTFVTGYFAIELSQYRLFGFPFSFYVFAQGSLVVFLFIIGLYVLVLNRMDRHFGVGERR